MMFFFWIHKELKIMISFPCSLLLYLVALYFFSNCYYFLLNSYYVKWLSIPLSIECFLTTEQVIKYIYICVQFAIMSVLNHCYVQIFSFGWITEWCLPITKPLLFKPSNRQNVYACFAYQICLQKYADLLFSKTCLFFCSARCLRFACHLDDGWQ